MPPESFLGIPTVWVENRARIAGAERWLNHFQPTMDLEDGILDESGRWGHILNLNPQVVRGNRQVPQLYRLYENRFKLTVQKIVVSVEVRVEVPVRGLDSTILGAYDQLPVQPPPSKTG